jgi:hypothetical protein
MSSSFDFDNGSYPQDAKLTPEQRKWLKCVLHKQQPLLIHILQGGALPSAWGADPEGPLAAGTDSPSSDPQKEIECQLENLVYDLRAEINSFRNHKGDSPPAAIDVATLDKYWPGVGAVYAAARGAART